MEYNNKLQELTQRQTELEHQVATYRSELERLDAQPFIDPGKYNGVKSELNYAQSKLDAVNAEIAELTGAAQTAQEELFSQFDSFEIDGMEFSLRALSRGEGEYQLISEFFQKHVADLAQRHAVVVSSYKSQIEQLESEASELENVRKLNYELSDKLSDMELRRDAAADELQQTLEENKRLQEDNRALRNKLESPVITNTTSIDTKEIARRIHEAKPRIYDVRWKDERKQTHYIARSAETDEEIEFVHYALASYRILEGEELARFREEKEKADLERLAQEAIEHTIDVPSLPYEDAGVSGESAAGEMVSETVTRAEFNELKDRVAQIEQQTGVRAVA